MKIPRAYFSAVETLLSKLPEAQKPIKGSNWTVGEHLEHCLAVNRSILKAMLDVSKQPGNRLTLSGRLILLSGWIPRGKAKAPEAVKPKHGGSAESIEKLSQLCRELEEQIVRAGSVNGFQHPRLGWCSPKQTFRFMEVHTRHHLKIMRETRTNAVVPLG